MTRLLELSINPLAFPKGFMPCFIARCADTWRVFQSRPTRTGDTWCASTDVVDLHVDDTPPLLLTPALRVDLPEPETLFALPFDETAWRGCCDRIAAEAQRGCGLVYEVYSATYSAGVDKAVAGLPSTHRARALSIACESGIYLTADEREQQARDFEDSGLCSHGLEPDCCPCGCGDLEG